MSLCLHCNHEPVNHQRGPCRVDGRPCESGCSGWDPRVEETQLPLTLHVNRLDGRAWITDPRGLEHPVGLNGGFVESLGMGLMGIALDVVDSGPAGLRRLPNRSSTPPPSAPTSPRP